MNEPTVWIGSIEHPRLGPLWVAVSTGGVVALHMRANEEDMRRHLSSAYQVVIDPGRVAPALHELSEYLAGKRRAFTVTIDWSPLQPFQRQVLQIVAAIPYGETRTYQQIADQLEKKGAARAVGRANATNPVPLIIPCHRVLGSDGSLRGYGGAGGVETKAWLLRLEGSALL